MYMNKLPFVITIFCCLIFRTAHFIYSMNASTPVTSIKKSFNSTAVVTLSLLIYIRTKNQDALKEDKCTNGARLNTTGQDKHIPEIERSIQVVKEQTRAE